MEGISIRQWRALVLSAYYSHLPPADVRTALNGAMQEAIKYGNKIAEEEGDDYRKKVIADNKAKVLPMSKAELGQWREAMKPVWKQFEGDIGKDLIDAAVAANGTN